MLLLRKSLYSSGGHNQYLHASAGLSQFFHGVRLSLFPCLVLSSLWSLTRAAMSYRISPQSPQPSYLYLLQCHAEVPVLRRVLSAQFGEASSFSLFSATNRFTAAVKGPLLLALLEALLYGLFTLRYSAANRPARCCKAKAKLVSERLKNAVILGSYCIVRHCDLLRTPGAPLSRQRFS